MYQMLQIAEICLGKLYLCGSLRLNHFYRRVPQRTAEKLIKYCPLLKNRKLPNDSTRNTLPVAHFPWYYS